MVFYNILVNIPLIPPFLRGTLSTISPVGMKKLTSGFICALIRMCAKIVALGLDQVGGQPGRS